MDTPWNTYRNQDSYYYPEVNPSSKTQLVLASSNVSLGLDQKVGTQNPNWRQQVARKQDATTNYTREFRRSTNWITLGESVTPIGPGGLRTIGRNFATGLDVPFGVDMYADAVLQDQALARIKRRLSNDIGDFSSMAPIAELHEMRGFIRNLAGLGVETFKALADIKRTKGRSAAKVASKIWLNFSFGAKPLMGAIKDASEAIDAYLTRTDHNLKVSGTASKLGVVSRFTSTATGAYNAPMKQSWRVEQSLSYRYSGAFNLQLKSGNNYGISDHFGFDWSELPGVAWELIPFSWAFDYFANVGSYLSDTFVLPNGSLLYLMVQRKYVYHADIYVNHVPTGQTFMRLDTGVPGSIDIVSYNRTKLSALPHRSLRLKTVDEVGRNAADKLLNLASILGGSSNFRRTGRL